MSFVGLDDSVDYSKAQSRSPAHLLRGEKRFEDMPLHLRRHTDTGIPYGKIHIIAGADIRVVPTVLLVEGNIRHAQSQFTTVRHSMGGIDTQICDHLLHLCRIPIYRCHPVR